MTMHPTLHKAFDQSRVLKVISGLNNFDAERVAATVKAADRGGASYVDIAADPDLVRLVRSVTNLPICVSAVEPDKFVSAAQAGADIIQTEGGTSSTPRSAGTLGLIEKAAPTLAAAYEISRAVPVPVLCASGISSVTVPMAIAAGAAGVGVGSAINQLDNEVAMVAAVRSLVEALATVSRDR